MAVTRTHISIDIIIKLNYITKYKRHPRKQLTTHYIFIADCHVVSSYIVTATWVLTFTILIYENYEQYLSKHNYLFQ